MYKTSGKTRFAHLEGFWVVAVQPGHWKAEELPEELSRLRTSTGAVQGEVREVDVNLRVADYLLKRIQCNGWQGLFIPATVRSGLRADAVISIHADYGNGSRREGWKLSLPFRASPASSFLALSLEEAFLDLSVGNLKSWRQ